MGMAKKKLRKQDRVKVKDSCLTQRIENKNQPQKHTAMNNENKCFFSISLENGITITGNNPKMVKDFLTDLSLCIGDATELDINKKHPGWMKHIQSLKRDLDNAWHTI